MIEGLVIAAAVLTTTLDEQGELEYRTQALKPTADRWVTLGVMEDRERAWFFTHHFSLDGDSEIMEDRLRRMDPDCPQVDYPLPSREVCFTNYRQAYTFVLYLRERLEYNQWPSHEEELTLILLDVEWRMKVWSELGDAQAQWGSRSGKRLRLQKVRELIGREDFDLHRFPDPLPAAAINSEWYYEPPNYYTP